MSNGIVECVGVKQKILKITHKCATTNVDSEKCNMICEIANLATLMYVSSAIFALHSYCLVHVVLLRIHILCVAFFRVCCVYIKF